MFKYYFLPCDRMVLASDMSAREWDATTGVGRCISALSPHPAILI